jgi:transporter family-2 protein
MTSTSTLWLFPLVAAGGALQGIGGPMNHTLRLSFGLIVPIFLVIAAVFVRPLPTVASIAGMPWWAPLGGIVGALAVVCGLLFIGTIGAGTYAALTVSANLITSLVIDHYGWLGVTAHPLTPARAIGGVVMVIGVILISSN